MGCELASPLLCREILSLTYEVVQFTDILDKTVWMQLVSLVTICADAWETNGESFPVVSTLLPCLGNHYSEYFPNSAFIYSFISYVSLKWYPVLFCIWCKWNHTICSLPICHPPTPDGRIFDAHPGRCSWLLSVPLMICQNMFLYLS